MKKSRAVLQVEDAQQSANKTIDQYDREIAAATRAAADLTRENQLIDRTLKNIYGSNIRDLEYSLKLAGRLGITSKAAIEEFVDAADKITVSLGK